MKKAKMFFTIGISLLLLCSVALLINNNIIAHASNTPPQKLIVNGSCENYFTPDTAYITMGVLKEDTATETAERTLEYIPTNLEVTLDTLKNNGVKTEDIYTRELNMPFDMFNNMRSQTISNVVEFKTNNIDHLDLLIEQLQKDNIGTVKCIRYALEDTSSSYGNVLTCAVDNAVAKVQAMYGNYTYNIVEVIEEGCFSPQCFSRCFANNGTNSNDILLCGNVKVVFELSTSNVNNLKEQNTPNAVILPNQEVLNQNTNNTTEQTIETENTEIVESENFESEVVESEEDNIDTEDNESLENETMEDRISE